MSKIFYFQSLESVLFASNPSQKIELFSHFYEDFLSNRVIFEEEYMPKIQTVPSYAGFCKIVHPTRIRRPKQVNSSHSLAKIIHSLLHIEYSAIDLALDASYRFAGLPREYYEDWLLVAKEEITHYLALERELARLGYQYGDFFVHQNLFDAMRATSHSLNHRMGLVHRALEAVGLDANPFVVKKLCSYREMNAALDMILCDEITHVKKGDKWWRFSLEGRESFVELLGQYQRFSPLGRVMNIPARLQAGYSQEELEELSLTSFLFSLE